MIDEFIPYLKNIIQAPISWLTSIFNAIDGSVGFVLAGFLLLLMIKFVLSPLLSGASIGSSDKAKKSKYNKNTFEERS